MISSDTVVLTWWSTEWHRALLLSDHGRSKNNQNKHSIQDDLTQQLPVHFDEENFNKFNIFTKKDSDEKLNIVDLQNFPKDMFLILFNQAAEQSFINFFYLHTVCMLSMHSESEGNISNAELREFRCAMW